MARHRDVCHSYIFPFVAETDGILQVTSCKGMSDNGFLLPTHQRITTHVRKRPMRLELSFGSLRAMH